MLPYDRRILQPLLSLILMILILISFVESADFNSSTNFASDSKENTRYAEYLMRREKILEELEKLEKTIEDTGTERASTPRAFNEPEFGGIFTRRPFIPPNLRFESEELPPLAVLPPAIPPIPAPPPPPPAVPSYTNYNKYPAPAPSSSYAVSPYQQQQQPSVVPYSAPSVPYCYGCTSGYGSPGGGWMMPGMGMGELFNMGMGWGFNMGFPFAGTGVGVGTGLGVNVG